jgi:hypothetical protein
MKPLRLIAVFLALLVVTLAADQPERPLGLLTANQAREMAEQYRHALENAAREQAKVMLPDVLRWVEARAQKGEVSLRLELRDQAVGDGYHAPATYCQMRSGRGTDQWSGQYAPMNGPRVAEQLVNVLMELGYTVSLSTETSFAGTFIAGTLQITW